MPALTTTRPERNESPARNAYEAAAQLLERIKQDAARLDGGGKLGRSLDELWHLFERCISDDAKRATPK